MEDSLPEMQDTDGTKDTPKCTSETRSTGVIIASTATTNSSCSSSVSSGSSSSGNSCANGNKNVEKAKKVQLSTTKIFVGSLPYPTRDESLYAYFIKFGAIVEATVKRNPITSISQGYGFVTMARAQDAARAILDPHPLIDNRKANVHMAIDKPHRRPYQARARQSYPLPSVPAPMQVPIPPPPFGRDAMQQLYMQNPNLPMHVPVGVPPFGPVYCDVPAHPVPAVQPQLQLQQPQLQLQQHHQETNHHIPLAHQMLFDSSVAMNMFGPANATPAMVPMAYYQAEPANGVNRPGAGPPAMYVNRVSMVLPANAPANPPFLHTQPYM